MGTISVLLITSRFVLACGRHAEPKGRDPGSLPRSDMLDGAVARYSSQLLPTDEESSARVGKPRASECAEVETCDRAIDLRTGLPFIECRERVAERSGRQWRKVPDVSGLV